MSSLGHSHQVEKVETPTENVALFRVAPLAVYAPTRDYRVAIFRVAPLAVKDPTRGTVHGGRKINQINQSFNQIKLSIFNEITSQWKELRDFIDPGIQGYCS